MTFCYGVQFCLALINQRLCGTSFALALLQQSLRGGNGTLCFFDLRDGFQSLFLQHASIHLRQHFTFANKLAFFHQNGVDTPGNFAGDIHFRRFNAPIADGKAFRHTRRAQQPPRHDGSHRQCPDNPPRQMALTLIHNRPAIIPVSNRRVLQLPPNDVQRILPSGIRRKWQIRPAHRALSANGEGLVKTGSNVVIISIPGRK